MNPVLVARRGVMKVRCMWAVWVLLWLMRMKV
jgi:hypothetical protein